MSSKTIGDCFKVIAYKQDRHYYKLINIKLNPAYTGERGRMMENATKLILSKFDFGEVDTLLVNCRVGEILIEFKDSGLISLKV